MLKHIEADLGDYFNYSIGTSAVIPQDISIKRMVTWEASRKSEIVLMDK